MTTKVFVGNLAFRTTDQDLQTHFANHGEIKSAIIITRGRRSLGYGFVEFANQADAENAATALDQSDLFERTIKVEIAKDISEREPRQPREPREPREPRKPKQPKEPKAKEEKEGEQNDGQGPAPRRRPRRPRRRNNKNGDNQEESAPAENASSENASGEGKKKKGRKPRQPRPQTEKVLSKTTLFVANLPFSIDDAALEDIFKGSDGFVSARVVRTRNGRSRGYGFVEFQNEDQQQSALTEKNGYKISGQNGVERAISISVSSSAPEAPAADEAQ